MISKCGMRCTTCPGYKDNVRTKAGRQKASDGWHKYLGVRLSPEKIYCDGCQVPDEKKPRRILRGCTLRNCVISNEIRTCAECSWYPCEQLTQNSYVNREFYEEKMGPIPEQEYLDFIEPYENLKHLDEIRAKLKPGQIVEPKFTPPKPRIVDFPNNLRFNKKEMTAYKALHKLISDIKLLSGKSYAQNVAFTKRRKHFLKLLWAFGLDGSSDKEKGDSFLTLDAMAYHEQKLNSDLRVMERYAEIMKEFGIKTEIVPLVEEKHGRKGYMTPGNSLRTRGWNMRMSFGAKAGGKPALKALRTYVPELDKEYGKIAFRYFSNADMRILVKDFAE